MSEPLPNDLYSNLNYRSADPGMRDHPANMWSLDDLYVNFPQGQCDKVAQFVQLWSKIVETTPAGYGHTNLYVSMPQMKAECPQLQDIEQTASIPNRVQVEPDMEQHSMFVRFTRFKPSSTPDSHRFFKG